jgi:hypothetical protein
MLTKIRNIMPMFWGEKHMPEDHQAPKLTAGKITMLTWAKIIESYADVPKTYEDFFAPLSINGQAFPYTILTPARDGFLVKSTEKLICILEQEIHVLEKSENTFEAQCYPIGGINYVEVKAVLLNSHIKINGMTKQGIPASSTIKFNSVGDYLFKPILKKIRFAGVDSKDAAQNTEADKFDHLIGLNYKFMNYGRGSLLSGEKVICFILQPEIRAPVMKILGKTWYRTICPTHMSILTDRELITIREDTPGNKADGKYGGIWNYIQLNKIMSLTLSTKDTDLLVLSIQMVEGVRLEQLFQVSARQELDQLLERFKELNTGQGAGSRK